MESGEGSAVIKARGPSLKMGLSNKRCSILGPYLVGEISERGEKTHGKSSSWTSMRRHSATNCSSVPC